MGTVDMVGSMGLTFFCNSFVEALFDFECSGNASQSLREMCRHAALSFESLKKPDAEVPRQSDRTALFDTEEDIRCFERILSGSAGDFSVLDKLVDQIRQVAEGTDLDARKKQAKELREFFDALGDCSVYMTRERLRDSLGDVV